jgi:predicted Zn-dependent peptidase
MIISEKHLENNSSIIAAQLNGAPSFAVFLGVRTGSRQDPVGREGMAHLLEHLAFKGTKKRPTFRDVAAELDRVGADFNAFTGREWLAFYVRCGAESASLAMDVLVDMYTSSVVADDSLAREKDVVTEELRMNANDGRLLADDLLHASMFSGTGLANPVGGSASAVQSVTVKNVESHIRQHFIGSKTVLGIAGNLQPDHVLEAQTLLNRVPDPAHAPDTVGVPTTALGQRDPQLISIDDRDIAQVHYVLSLPGWEATNENRYAVGMLHTILGGGMLSRLFGELRASSGLSYYVGADHATYRDAGSLNLRAGVQPSRLPEAVKVMVDQLLDLRKNGVSEDELDRAKSYSSGRLQLGMSDPRGTMLFLMRRACTDGSWEHPDVVAARTQKVTTHDVMDVLDEALGSLAPTLSCVGPVPQETEAVSELARLIG